MFESKLRGKHRPAGAKASDPVTPPAPVAASPEPSPPPPPPPPAPGPPPKYPGWLEEPDGRLRHIPDDGIWHGNIRLMDGKRVYEAARKHDDGTMVFRFITEER